MATHASAAKRARQNIKRAARNRAVRSSVRTKLKNARTAIASGDSKAAAPLVRDALSALARAVSKGVVHHNTASRTTSRISAQLAKLGK